MDKNHCQKCGYTMDYDTLRANVAEDMEMLKKMANRQDPMGCEQCLCCGRWKQGDPSKDHLPNCELYALIKKREGKT